MKKILFTAFFSALLITASAQKQPVRPLWSFGANLGLTYSSIDFSPKVQQSLRKGLSGGFTARWMTDKNLGLQAELNITQRGWEELFEEQPQYSYDRLLTYLEVPFMTHIQFNPFFINLGPQLAYLLGESTQDGLNGDSPNTNNEQHDLAVERKFDYGITAGLGYELRTGIGRFILEGRYYIALSNIYNSSKQDPFPKSANHTISAKLTYLFDL